MNKLQSISEHPRTVVIHLRLIPFFVQKSCVVPNGRNIALACPQGQTQLSCSPFHNSHNSAWKPQGKIRTGFSKTASHLEVQLVDPGHQILERERSIKIDPFPS